LPVVRVGEVPSSNLGAPIWLDQCAGRVGTGTSRSTSIASWTISAYWCSLAAADADQQLADQGPRQGDGLLASRERLNQADTAGFFVTDRNAEDLKYLGAVVEPLLLFAIGAVVFVRRRFFV